MRKCSVKNGTLAVGKEADTKRNLNFQVSRFDGRAKRCMWKGRLGAFIVPYPEWLILPLGNLAIICH